MSHRYTRAARSRAKPGNRVDREASRHHGDEFDELVPNTGHLTVVPVRTYVPHVPQVFDEFKSRIEPSSRQNQLGPIIEGAEPVITDSKSFDSYLAAFDKRSNSQPDDDDDCTEAFKDSARRLWLRVLPTALPEWDVDEVATERWLAKMDPVKQTRMKKALLELFDCESDPGYLGEKTLSVKVEALLKRYDNKWAPRLIYEGNDHFNALTGPVCMLLMERVDATMAKQPIGPVAYRTAYKRQGPELVSHLAEAHFENRHVAEGDFSANDLRQRKFATELFGHVAELHGAPSWFIRLLADMRKFRVKSLVHGHRAMLANQLPTGTTITTVRNSVWNATIESCYMAATGNSGRALILGDDFLGVFKHKVNCSHWSEWVEVNTRMKLTGCTPELQGAATFLSRRLLVDSDTPCMMPKLGKALARFNARTSKNEAISDSSYMAGKALSYAYEFRHFPIFRDLFLMRYRAEGGYAVVDRTELSWYTRTSGVDVDRLEHAIVNESVVISEDETREFLMDAYGDTFGIVDALAIAKRIVLCSDLSSVCAPDELSIDW